jgi:SAM-dependent methyltransferase
VATALPFPDATFDAAVACLVFEHIEDADGALAEVSRVLVDGGRFLFLLNHPLLQAPGSGWIDDQVLDPPEQYWRVGAYLVEETALEQVDYGLWLPFVHRPLSRYVNTTWRSPPRLPASWPGRASTRTRSPSPASCCWWRNVRHEHE